MPEEDDYLTVEVVYALADRAVTRTLRVPPGSSVAEALRRSGIQERFEGRPVTALPVACFGRRVDAADAVKDGDRLELLRPLLVDPKEARRARRRLRQD